MNFWSKVVVVEYIHVDLARKGDSVFVKYVAGCVACAHNGQNTA